MLLAFDCRCCSLIFIGRPGEIELVKRHPRRYYRQPPADRKNCALRLRCSGGEVCMERAYNKVFLGLRPQVALSR